LRCGSTIFADGYGLGALDVLGAERRVELNVAVSGPIFLPRRQVPTLERHASAKGNRYCSSSDFTRPRQVTTSLNPGSRSDSAAILSRPLSADQSHDPSSITSTPSMTRPRESVIVHALDST
jgi:hypothetical protein